MQTTYGSCDTLTLNLVLSKIYTECGSKLSLPITQVYYPYHLLLPLPHSIPSTHNAQPYADIR